MTAGLFCEFFATSRITFFPLVPQHASLEDAHEVLERDFGHVFEDFGGAIVDGDARHMRFPWKDEAIEIWSQQDTAIGLYQFVEEGKVFFFVKGRTQGESLWRDDVHIFLAAYHVLHVHKALVDFVAAGVAWLGCIYIDMGVDVVAKKGCVEVG